MDEVIKKQKNKKKKIGAGWIILICFGAIIGIFVLIAILNLFYNLSLRNYIKSFSPVSYMSQLEPSKDDDGYTTFTTDNDFNIMQITDVHLGGGFLSFKKDKECINCVITMIQNEKPDLVVFTGDNIFAIPYISGTVNNYMVAKTFILMAEQTGAYWTTVFGNHDTEIFDYYNRFSISKLYSKDKWKHCLYESAFLGVKDTSYSNSVILIKSSSGLVRKAIFMLDSNSYINDSLSAVLKWQYDVIHQSQVDWAYATYLNVLSKNNNLPFQSLFFFHIPISEFELAYEDLKLNHFNDTLITKYISGSYDELDDDTILDKGRIWYGGSASKDSVSNIADLDNLFEKFKGVMEGCFCGHDHVNNGVVKYQGVYLSYGYSVDYLAYSNINLFGKQRGNTIITIKTLTNDISISHNNYYQSNYISEKGIETDASLDSYYYPNNEVPSGK